MQGGGFRTASAEEVNDIFSQFFGGGGGGNFAGMFEQQRRQAAMRGADMQATLRITLREAAEGAHKTLKVPSRNIRGQRETRTVQVDIPAGVHACICTRSL